MLKSIKSFISITQLFPSVPEQQGMAFYLTAAEILGELTYSLPWKFSAQVLTRAAVGLVGSSGDGWDLLCALGWSGWKIPRTPWLSHPTNWEKDRVALGNHPSILTDLSYIPVKLLQPLK